MPQTRDPKGQPCTRAVAEQCSDTTGARRRTDHPQLRRLDLLSDEALEELQRRLPDRAAHALYVHDDLDEALQARAKSLERAREELDGAGAGCPILTVVICLACGASDVATMHRAWPIERAMARTDVAERDLLAVVGLLAMSYDGTGTEPPHLDALRPDDIHALVGMVRRHADAAEVRALLGVPTSEVRLTREEMLRALKRS